MTALLGRFHPGLGPDVGDSTGLTYRDLMSSIDTMGYY